MCKITSCIVLVKSIFYLNDRSSACIQHSYLYNVAKSLKSIPSEKLSYSGRTFRLLLLATPFVASMGMDRIEQSLVKY